MDEHRMARRVLMAEVSGVRVRGRTRLGSIDGVKVALGGGCPTTLTLIKIVDGSR